MYSSRVILLCADTSMQSIDSTAQSIISEQLCINALTIVYIISRKYTNILDKNRIISQEF